MTTQLLIYENVVQLQGELGAAGGRWSSPRAAAEYPIVFAGTEETVMPVAAVDAELLAHPKGKAGGRKK